MPIKDVLRRRAREVEKLRAKAAQMQEWFESAMVMVDNVPVGVAWSDPQRDFVVTYVNGVGAAMIGPAAGGADAIVGQRLSALFAPLVSHHSVLADPARLPLRLRVPVGGLTLDLQVVAIRNKSGVYSGAMAVWSDISAQAKLADDFEAKVKAVVDELAGDVTGLRVTARALTTTADETRQRSRQVSGAATEASENVDRVAAAAGELSASIAEIGRQVAQSTTIAAKAVAEANRADGTVQSLAAVAGQIGQVVGLIQSIASQTNLLALNATIEAARAGDAGKGFAVVASEVKNLAAQTAKATDDIRAQVEDIQRVSGETVRTIQSIGATIAEISDISTGIGAAVEEQGAATQEIAGSVTRVAAGTAQVSTNVGDILQASTRLGTAVAEIDASIGELSARSTRLRSEVEDFLAAVR